MKAYLFALLFFPAIVFAQYSPLPQQKAELILSIYKGAFFPVEKTQYNLVVYTGNDEVFRSLKKLNKKKITHLNIVKAGSDATVNADLIFVDKSRKGLADSIVSFYKGKPVLIITDQWDNLYKTQINLFVENSGKKVGFEYNMFNISAQGISFPNNYLKDLGGVDINILLLYNRLKADYKKLKKQNEILKRRIDSLSSELEKCK